MAGMEINHINTSGVDDTTLQAHISRLSSYRDELQAVVEDGSYNSPESALILPSDMRLTERIAEVVDKFNTSVVTDVVVLGMGGSTRGAQAAYDLLAGQDSANFHTIDTVADNHITNTVSTLAETVDDLQQVVVCVVSKSGQTAETIANTNVLLDRLGKHFNSEALTDQIVVVSQSGSELSKQANDEGMKTVNIPEQVSGRFSAFSAAGLLPLALAGIDTAALQAGARSLREVCLSGRPVSDPAAALASILHTHTEASIRILNHFFFTPQASSLGHWSEQLFAESLGKQKNKRGKPVFSGLYPVTSIGPDDLHASYQLQLGGPKNFLTFFVRERNQAGDLDLPITDHGLLPSKLSHLSEHTLGDLQTALTEATLQSFRDDGRPFVEISVAEFDEKRLGQFMLLEELVVMYAGYLLDINTFNQPQVETYKKLTRERLTTS